jgi:hypothetical protein
MAAIPGKNLLLYVELTPGVWTSVCASTSHTLNIATEHPEAVTKCSGGWAEHLTDGRKSWTVDVDGLHDPDQDVTIDDLIAYQIAGLGMKIKMSLTDAGTTYYEGEVSIDTSSITAPADGFVGWSLTFIGNGELEPKVVAGASS